jgi:hypothetical protein
MNKQEFDEVRKLAVFLEQYIPEINKLESDKFYTFPIADQSVWSTYYKDLISTNVLPNETAFGVEVGTGKKGVGKDGICSSTEFYQLLMQCYKYMYQALSVGEVYLKYNGWYLAQKEGNEKNAADNND